MIRSGNPALKSTTFSSVPRAATFGGDTMTIQGTSNKAFIMLGLVLAPALYTWNLALSEGPEVVFPLSLVGGIGGLVIALVLAFKKTWAPVLAPLYAVAQGLALGAISSLFETKFPGIVIQAVGLTFGIFAALLMAYKSRMIQATENFKLGVTAATGGIFLFYLVQFGLSFFGIKIPYIHESGIIGIGFSLFVCVIAALNLVMDFDFIEEGEKQGAPKYMEWYAAFGLVVTLVWLYLEILRLLAKLRSK
jgi:uncharacterized YccA/Bax inhibitor family protein